MRAGDSPAQMMSWLAANDFQFSSATRQYGAIRIGQLSAAFTGTSCTDYKGHRVGANYTIHGNILLGAQVLDSMEARFLRAEGDLACRLMAALQGAKMIGADTRCAANNSSSLFAFLKIATPTNSFGTHHFFVSLRTHSGDSIEPIDSLQKLFDFQHLPCVFSDAGLKEHEAKAFSIWPNPVAEEVVIIGIAGKELNVTARDLCGREVLNAGFSGRISVDVRNWIKGLYLFEVRDGHQNVVKKVIIE
jgi:uncharacterized Ntn-hydrolase superfamily protein